MSRSYPLLPLWIVLFILSLPLIAPGCGGEEPELRLTRAEYPKVDTIVQRRMEGIREEIDSICETNFDKWVLEAADSIIKVRKSEEAKLRERIRARE